MFEILKSIIFLHKQQRLEKSSILIPFLIKTKELLQLLINFLYIFVLHNIQTLYQLSIEIRKS